MPRATKSHIDIIVNSPWHSVDANGNAAKQHLFRVYQDGHVGYDQIIYGSRFYGRFDRATKRHGYADMLRTVTTCPTKFARNAHLLLAV